MRRIEEVRNLRAIHAEFHESYGPIVATAWFTRIVEVVDRLTTYFVMHSDCFFVTVVPADNLACRKAGKLPAVGDGSWPLSAVDVRKYGMTAVFDGKWHYIRDTWNADTPPAAADQATAPPAPKK
jgi:hypothetical protein